MMDDDVQQKTIIGLMEELDGLRQHLTQLDEELFHARQMLQTAINHIPLMFFWKDRDLVYQGCNMACARQAGLNDPAEIVGKTDDDLSWKESARYFQEDDRAVMGTDTPRINIEESIYASDGSRIWLRTNKMPLHDRNGAVIGLLGASEDISERKQTEEEIQQANEKLISWVSDLERRNQEARLLRQMSDLLQVCDDRDKYYAIIQNHVHLLFPYTSGAIFIFDPLNNLLEAMVLWGKAIQSAPRFTPQECQTLTPGPTDGTSHCAHLSNPFLGSHLEVLMVASGETIGLLYMESPEEELLSHGLKNLARTVADHLSLCLSNLKLRETLRAQSIHDTLTGLYNRRYMEEVLTRELPRAVRKKSKIGIIMVDVDHFKQYNDTHGHEAGDLVLHQLSLLLQSLIRTEDVSCRFGGEEFILIMPEANLEVTAQRADLILKSVRDMQVNFHGQLLDGITLSMGVAVFPDHGATAEEIIRKADAALYHAKHSGRNRVEMAAR